jgi:hypothetical protein
MRGFDFAASPVGADASANSGGGGGQYAHVEGLFAE